MAVITDFGNRLVKAKWGDEEAVFPHALASLDWDEYTDIVNRSGGQPGDDFVVVNSQAYALGETAMYHEQNAQKIGAARYERAYYGPLLCAMLQRLGVPEGDVFVFPSFAPMDSAHYRSVCASAYGEWQCVVNETEYRWHVKSPRAFVEPLGGLMNYLIAFNEYDDPVFRSGAFNGGVSLVIDVGGKTTDWQVMLPGGKPDPAGVGSVDIGIMDVERTFEEIFTHTNREIMKGSRGLNPAQLETGIKEGSVRVYGEPVDAGDAKYRATNQLLNRLDAALQRYLGGVGGYEMLVLTGGGSALLEAPLRNVLRHGNVQLAGDKTSLHMANVRGGDKLWRIYEQEGVV